MWFGCLTPATNLTVGEILLTRKSSVFLPRFTENSFLMKIHSAGFRSRKNVAALSGKIENQFNRFIFCVKYNRSS
jgi:hypothetical protein